MQAIDITVNEKRLKYYSTNTTSYKSLYNIYRLEICKELNSLMIALVLPMLSDAVRIQQRY
jgi:hypothetical protein